MEKEIMNLQEAADYLSVHVSTIRRRIKDEKDPLPTVRFGERVIRIRKSELEAWLKTPKAITLTELMAMNKEELQDRDDINNGRRKKMGLPPLNGKKEFKNPKGGENE